MKTFSRPWQPLLSLLLLGQIATVHAYTAAPVTFQWDTFTGTPLVLGDNEMSGAIALPFAFNFLNGDPYLRPYATVHVSSNGFLTFLEGQPDGCTGQPAPCGGQNLPNATG